MHKDGYVIVGICGYAESGKDTAAEVLTGMLGYTRIAFGDKLREVLYEINPVIMIPIVVQAKDEEGRPLIGKSTKAITPGQLQDLVDKVGWDKAKEVPDVRRLLQSTGTAVRNVDPDFWETVAMKGLTERTVFTDVRFHNQFAIVRAYDGLLIRIMRAGVEPKNGHISDLICDEYLSDCIQIHNNGTVEELHAHVVETINTYIGEKVR